MGGVWDKTRDQTVSDVIFLKSPEQDTDSWDTAPLTASNVHDSWSFYEPSSHGKAFWVDSVAAGLNPDQADHQT